MTAEELQTGTRFRWYVAGMLSLATMLNYLDRQTLSVLAHTIQQELHLSSVGYSYVTSSFLVSYTVMYAVSGRLVDRLGTRRSFMVFVSLWSVASMMHGLSRSALHLGAFRFLLGATQAANFPAGIKAVSEWFPMRERALASGLFNAGTALGGGLAVPVVSVIALHWGWRSAFVVTGALGFVWLAAWAALYRPPPDDTPAGAIPPAAPPIRVLLGMRETWGCILARVLTDPITYFLMFWIPKYLQQERGFSMADLAKLGWIPFVALGIGNIAGGAIPRWLAGRGWPVGRARKTTMLVVSCAMPVCYLIIAIAPGAGVALAAIAAAMFGHAAWGNIALPAEVFPKHVVGAVSGFGGALGGLAGVITQLSVGWVVQNLSFTPVFGVCSVMYLVALATTHGLIRKLGTIREVP